MDATLLPTVYQVADNYGLPRNLLQAQCEQESNGDPFALRYEPHFFDRYIRGNPNAKAGQYGAFAACSLGLLQIMVETAYEIGFTDRPEALFNPRVGLAWGAKRMNGLLAASGNDYPSALAAYNGGPALLHLSRSNWPVPVYSYVQAVYSKAQLPVPGGG